MKILLSKLNKKTQLSLIGALRILLVIVPFFITSFVPSRSPRYTLSRVVIDAGHGGHDSGCLGSKSKEKDIALAVALKLGRYIKDNYKDVEVIYTRKTDVFVELYERASIANNAKADLFICIHCNSACVYDKRKKRDICNEEPHGVETWVMGLNKSEANLAVAKRENEVVLLEKDYQKQYDGFDPNSPEANIIFSLYQNTFLEQSLRFATGIEDEIGKKGRERRGVKQAGFLVLYKTYMPSVLIETGFLSNPSEEKFLSSEKGQDQMAHSIYNAFKSYKNSVESGIQVKDKENKSEDTTELDEDKAMHEDSSPQKPEKEHVKPEVAVKNGSGISKKDKTEEIKTPVRVVSKQEELIFSVQIVLSPKPLPMDSQRFKDAKDIREEHSDGMYKYCSGNFISLNEAINRQNRLRETGFKDAFVVAFLNGKRISISEARKMLKVTD